jgi:hypothetical protein
MLEEIADGAVIYNSRRFEQKSITEAGIFDAFRIFHEAKKAGRVNQLRNQFHGLFDRYHDQIIEKLTTEKTIAEMQRDLQDARDRNNSRLASILNIEIGRLEVRLAGMIDIWKLIRNF